MLRSGHYFRSIVTKLVFLNTLIFLALLGILIANFFLSRQTENMVVDLVDRYVPQEISNRILSRNLNEISNDIRIMLINLTLNTHTSRSEAIRLNNALDTLLSSDNEIELKTPLIYFSGVARDIFDRCAEIDDLKSKLESIEKEIVDGFDDLEVSVTNSMIERKLQGKEYELSSVEQISSVIPDLRNLLLRTKMLASEYERTILTHDKANGTSQQALVSLLTDAESGLATANTAGDEFLSLGNNLIRQIRLYKENILLLIKRTEELEEKVVVLLNQRSEVKGLMDAMGKRVSDATGEMRQVVIKSLRSFGSIMLALSILVVALLIVVGVVGAGIARPIQKLTVSVTEIAAGDLEKAIEVGGNDEVGILSRSFAGMRDAIKGKIDDLAEKNRELSQEILERKRIEDALRKSETKYRTLLENLPQKIFHKDLQSIYVSGNAAYCRDLKLHPEDIVGKRDYDFFPKEMADKYIADDERIMASGKTEELEEKYFREGQEFIINTVKVPLKDEQGNAVGILGIFWDITEKKRAEEELRKFERIVATTKDLMSIIDTNFAYQAANDAFLEIHGKSREEVVGHRVSEILGEDVFNLQIAPKLAHCLKGKEVVFQKWFDYPGIGERYMDVALHPFFGNDGSVSGVVVNSRDITLTKRLEVQLAQSQKMEAIGTLAGGIAHDFNNILSAIMGFTELALLEAPRMGRIQACLGEVLKATQRAKELVHRILAFSRQSEQQKRPMRLAPVIDEVLKMLRASIPSTIEIRTEIDAQSGAIMAEPTQIHQVLMNLCTNSSHAMREKGGVLFVGLKDVVLPEEAMAQYTNLKSRSCVRLTVSDTGHGIEPNALDRIFEPYYTTKEKGVGTGLGLAAVHGIVQGYEGAIAVVSQPGEGATFHIYLPRIEMADPKDMEGQASWEQTPLHRGEGCILLVDDEEALLRVGSEMLAHLGYEVVVRNGSEEALELFRASPERFDLVITDQTMPKMTGQELARELMKIRPDVLIILCTGFSELVDERKAKEIGIREFVMKPFTLRALSEVIRTARATDGVGDGRDGV